MIDSYGEVPTREADRLQKGLMSLPSNSAVVRHYVQTDDSVPRMFDAYYRSDSDLDPAAVFDVAEAMNTGLKAGMIAVLPNWLASDSRYLGCTCHVYIRGDVGSSDLTNSAGAVGTLTGDTEPDYVAAVIRRYATGGGPSHRGRVFIPAVAEINTNTSRLSDEGVAALAAIRDALNTDIDPVGGEGDFADLGHWEPALWSRKAAATLPIVRWIAEDVLVTQRRRRLRPLQ